MIGIVLHCAYCRKLLIKDACLISGSSLKVKCFHCGHLISIAVEHEKTYIKDHDTGTPELRTF